MDPGGHRSDVPIRTVGQTLARRRFLGLLAGLGWLLFSGEALGKELTDEAGRRVQVPDSPRRIVSLAPSITECLFALGLNPEVVGVTQYSNYPSEAASKPKVGSYVHINLERVLALQPDLVLAIRDGNPRDQVERLARMVPAVFVMDPRSLEGLFRTLETLGEILQREEGAAAIVRGLKQRMERIQGLLAGRVRPRVFLQVGVNPLVTVGKGTLQDHLLALAGGENVAGSELMPYPILSLERVLEARPEVILVSSMVEKVDADRELQRWGRWKEIPAVAQGRVHVIEGDLIDRPSPRILDGLEAMAALIHPGVAAELGQGGVRNRSTEDGIQESGGRR
jgi:iron complex transport system substrate-binding protein